MELLLASKSPRRRQLLSELQLPLQFVDIDVDEHLPRPVAASEAAEAIARLKAEAFLQPLAPGQVLVTADTVVVLDEQVLGKPHDRQEALSMLRALSGRTHQVYTGVCLRNAVRQHSFTECTHVTFRSLSEQDLAFYVDRYHPYDKAGSYGIQEWIGMVGIERIEGCYYNVMGLPVARLCKELQRLID